MGISYGEIVSPIRRFDHAFGTLDATTAAAIPIAVPGMNKPANTMTLVSARLLCGTADAVDADHNLKIALYKVPVSALGVAGTPVVVGLLHWDSASQDITRSDSTTQAVAGAAITAFVGADFTITTLDTDYTFDYNDVLTVLVTEEGTVSLANARVEVDFVWGRV